MCGIAGHASFSGDDPVAERLGAGIAHRGPDGVTWGVHAGHCLVQARLAIIDLSDRVVYPMSNEDGTVWLVYNGEIYNFRELRRELEGLGHVFANDCDAEVIVHGWEQWGEGVLARLSGMFAMALADERTGELVLARDRLGIKPLAYTTGERFGFASDAMTLVQAGLSGGDIDVDAVAEFAAFHYVPPPLTGVADIRQLEPGCLLRRGRDGGHHISRWARGSFSVPAAGDAPDAAELDAALSRAVERHLVADVEVGILLSGGTDSRLVLALAAELGARPRAYTMSFAGHGDYDESPVARATAAAFGVEHRETRLTLDFDPILDGVAAAYDQPFADASAIATLAVSRLAREDVKVVLSGTGGDDLFAGYARHRAHRVQRAVGLLPAPVRASLRRMRTARGAERASLLATLRAYGARLATAADGDVYAQYLALVADHSSPVAADLLAADTGMRREDVARRLGLRAPGAGSVLRELQAFELRTYLPGDLLTKEDRATMAVGLEGRVPLLDLEVLALAERTRDAQRATLRSGKRLLREVATRRLATAPPQGRKRGFAVPLDDLMAGSWRGPAAARLRDNAPSTFDGRAAGQLLEAGELPATDGWALSVLGAWEARLRAARSVGRRERRESRAGRQ
jgi:asparagine synthase (glutamine-hydrolysing)